MAKRTRTPDSVSENGQVELLADPGEAAHEDEIEPYLADEPEPQPQPRASDPARGRGPVPVLDHYHEYLARLEECGINLRAFLYAHPVAVDALSPLEEAIVKATVGWRVLERAGQKANAIAKAERDARRASMKREPYPSVSRAQFDYLNRTPGYRE